MNDKYENIRKAFEKFSNEERATSMAQYMQNRFFFGIDAPVRKFIEKEFINKEKSLKIIDWTFLDACYADKHRELHYFVLDVLESMHKCLTINDIPQLEYFVENNQWWDSIDKLDKIIGNINYNSVELDSIMMRWSKHENMWHRRLAIDHQQGRKEKTNKDLLEQIILNNLGSKEFFINKAIGWSLREYSKINPSWVKNFLMTYQCQLDKLSYKEAIKLLNQNK